MNTKFVYIAALLTLIPSLSMAQLAANPWANQPVTTVRPTSAPSLSVNKNATENSWNIEKPAFIGENTTWKTAMGQREIAPDVNITNMLLMSQHLRNMGYQIPEGLDTLISTAPARLRQEIWASMKQLQNSTNPVALVSVGFAEVFESRTGFSIENLIGNSLRLIDSRR